MPRASQAKSNADADEFEDMDTVLQRGLDKDEDELVNFDDLDGMDMGMGMDEEEEEEEEDELTGKRRRVGKEDEDEEGDDMFYEEMVQRREKKKQDKADRKKYQELHVNDDYVRDDFGMRWMLMNRSCRRERVVKLLRRFSKIVVWWPVVRKRIAIRVSRKDFATRKLSSAERDRWLLFVPTRPISMQEKSLVFAAMWCTLESSSREYFRKLVFILFTLMFVLSRFIGIIMIFYFSLYCKMQYDLLLGLSSKFRRFTFCIDIDYLGNLLMI